MILCENYIAWNIFLNDLRGGDTLNAVPQPLIVKGTYSSSGNGQSFARHISKKSVLLRYRLV